MYHNIDKEEIIKQLDSNYITGLSNEEVDNRIKKYGKNTLPKKKRDSILKIFISEIMNPIIILLIITVIFSFLVNEVVDAVAIIFIILIDLILGTVQEWKAEKNADSLQQLIKYKVKVIRDSKEIEVDSTNLVIGDIVLLSSGDKISADIRIIESHNLQVDESVLTGESVSIYKLDRIEEENTPLAERKNMLYAGTNVTTGRCRGVVVETGINTEIGKIANLVTESKDTKSPLTIRMEKLSKQISLLVVIVGIIITLILIAKGVDHKEIFLSVIALSVSAMPEGLPLALTMALTITSNKMSKKNVIVKKLNYVESLGSCTCIATDKTGTLTINEQTAKKITLPEGSEYNITGTGYNFDGIIENIDDNKLEIYNLVKLGVINNESGIEKIDNNYNYYGDSIDIAFLVLGKKANIDISDIEIIERIPYESENKYSAVFYKINNEIHCTVKGSLEKILEFCNTDNQEKYIKQNEELANNGYRVIALADGIINNFIVKDYYDSKDISNLEFKGLVSFIDPVREEVKESINEANDAGIKVLMITGDHPLTALSIAKELNIATNSDEVCDGKSLNEYYNKGLIEFDNFIKTKKVFARVTPIDKLHIVESLRRNDEFVAVTGDGVNDALAIKNANIGIAMGSGTDVSKETANMIIIDDNFKSIVSGIELGRCAYSNIRKVCYLLLSCGLAEVLFFILSIIFNLPMPLVAIQLLWLNLVTDGLQDISLSCEKIEKGTMKEKPRNPNESIFNKTLLQEVLLSGLIIGIIVFITWVYLINVLKMDVGIARGYIMVLMVFMQNMHVLNCRSEKQSTFDISIKSNPLIIITIISSIILQIIVIEVPILSKFLQTSTVPILHMIILFIISTIILLVMETYKMIKYKNNN